MGTPVITDTPTTPDLRTTTPGQTPAGSARIRPGRLTPRPPAAQVDLAARCRAGDRDAFAQLYQLTEARITRYVAVRMRERDRDAIDDLVQDTYCAALAEPRLLGDDPFGGLLRLAARACACHDWSQRRYVRAAYQLYADHALTTHNAITADAAAPAAPIEASTAALVQAMAGLRRDHRRALTLRYIDGHPRERAAKIMRRSVPSMRELERRARMELRRAVAEAPTASSATAAASASPGSPAHP